MTRNELKSGRNYSHHVIGDESSLTLLSIIFIPSSSTHFTEALTVTVVEVVYSKKKLNQSFSFVVHRSKFNSKKIVSRKRKKRILRQKFNTNSGMKKKQPFAIVSAPVPVDFGLFHVFAAPRLIPSPCEIFLPLVSTLGSGALSTVLSDVIVTSARSFARIS